MLLLYSLLGLCRGLIADQTINPREVLFLDTWLRNQTQLHDDPDGRDLLCCIEDILRDNRIDAEELDDLQRLIETVLRYREVTPGEADEINLPLGLLTGISADHHINTAETQFLHQWLARNIGLHEIYPASVVYDAVADILADGIVTDAEKKSLIQLLHSIVGNQYEQTGIACGLSTEFCCQYIDSLDYADKLFCITGALTLGSRVKAFELINQRGGRTRSALRNDLGLSSGSLPIRKKLALRADRPVR